MYKFDVTALLQDRIFIDYTGMGLARNKSGTHKKFSALPSGLGRVA